MGSPEQIGRLQERRAVVPSLALGIYAVVTAVFLTILLLSPDGGPGLGPGLQAIGLAYSFAAPGVAVVVGRFDSDLQALMGGTLIAGSIAAGFGGSILIPFGLVAGLAMLVSVRGPLRNGVTRLGVVTVLATVIQVAAYGFSLRADWIGTIAAFVISTGLVLSASRLAVGPGDSVWPREGRRDHEHGTMRTRDS